MSFTVKNWTAYTDNATTEKNVVLLLALPDGSGGFSFINMTKEEFFNISDDMTIKFNPSAGTINLIEFDQLNTVVLKYLASGQIAILDNMANWGLSNTGTTNQVGLSIVGGNGRLYAGTNAGVEGELYLYDSNGDRLQIITSLTADETARFEDGRSAASINTVKYRQDDVYQRTSAANAGSTTLPSGNICAMRSNVTGGSITSHTYDFPANPSNGDRIRLAVSGSITTTIMAAPGATTIESPFTSVTTFASREWAYDALNDEWTRIE